jgi:hypothetical protein
MQNSVCSNTDAVLFETLAKMTITKRDYCSIELGGHTHSLHPIPQQARPGRIRAQQNEHLNSI